MIELSYSYENEFLANTAYQLMRVNMNDPWLVLSGSDVVGIINHDENDSWQQIAGEDMPRDAVKGMGELIAMQQFSWLPRLIKKQWPEYVQEVIVESEKSFEVVCHKDTCPDRFKQRFTPGIHALAKRETELVFKVCRFNISGYYQVVKTRTADRYA